MGLLRRSILPLRIPSSVLVATFVTFLAMGCDGGSQPPSTSGRAPNAVDSNKLQSLEQLDASEETSLDHSTQPSEFNTEEYDRIY